MKLAEALILRKDVQKRLSILERRLLDSARVQEGDLPFEDPQALRKELDALCAQLEDLITRINHTNSVTVQEGETITQMLSRRDVLGEKTRIMRNLANTASDLVNRARHTEIRIESTVDVATTRRQADELAKELRELDTRIQGLNWTTDLR